MTRQQAHLMRAMDHITAVSHAPQPVREIYGGLCHTFPAMVRTNGLCQALAFVAEKQHGWNDQHPKPRAVAYHRLLEHVGATLDVRHAGGQAPLDQAVLTEVRGAPLLTYMRYTTLVLEAWVYYKRLAVSVLDVQAGTTPAEEP